VAPRVPRLLASTAAAALLLAAAPASAHGPQPDLTLGDSGTAVAVLQADLLDLGYTRLGTADGTFGPKTLLSLVGFQWDHGLPVSEHVDGATWQAIDDALAHADGLIAQGDRGPAVTRLQQRLRALGYTQVGAVDGVFGPSSDAALRAFQSDHGLIPNGVDGPATQAALAQAGAMGWGASGGNGSGSAPQQSDGGGSGRTLTLVATAYGPSLQDNYPYGPVDYFGSPLKPGDVAVDPRVIPLGTRLYITGYHSPDLPQGGMVAVARDTGGAIKGDRIDIFIDGTPQQVSDFGIQTVHVRVLGS
jgi:peptidoglycan hydrolase-like protein with peptidoglycan-binding domain